MPCLQMAMRACSLTAENKRRTLQRNDIAMAVAKTDTYDFLIDIVPRDEVRSRAGEEGRGCDAGSLGARGSSSKPHPTLLSRKQWMMNLFYIYIRVCDLRCFCVLRGTMRCSQRMGAGNIPSWRPRPSQNLVDATNASVFSTPEFPR